MAMRPAIAEHVLGSVVCGSLDGKLQAITGSPNVQDMAALRKNCSSARENFSTGGLLDSGVGMILKHTEQDSLAKLQPALHWCEGKTKHHAQGP
jgi:hypothetical protein